jgi:probable phosphoglycerate mutase
MSHIVLIRPGCTDFDEQQRIQGALDLPLNARGEQQVHAMLQELQHVPIDLIYTSECEPARSTAAQLGATLGITVREIEGLRNLNQGLWQGLHIDDVRHKHPRVYKQWQESPETICPPEGETVAEAIGRVQRALERPLKKKGNLAIVASEPLAALIRCTILGCKPGCISMFCGPEQGRIWEILNPGAPSDRHEVYSSRELSTL